MSLLVEMSISLKALLITRRYLQKKISADFLKKVYNAYLQIQEWLIETGDTFCCIVPENEKLSELDLMVNIKSVHRYRLQSPLFVGGA